MKKFCTPLIFTIFFLVFTSISNAMDRGSSSSSEVPKNPSAPRYLFGVNQYEEEYSKLPNVFSCPINLNNGVPMNTCRPQAIPIYRTSIISVAPNTNYAYVVTTHHDLENNGVISVCHIDSATGKLEDCKLSGARIPYTNQIAINYNSQFMYIGTSNGEVFHCSINKDSGMLHDCKEVGSGFEGFNGMAISPHNNYIFLTNAHSSSVTICKINPDFTFSECTPNPNALYKTPGGIAADPFGRYVYISDTNKNYFISCKFDQNEPKFTSCSKGAVLFNPRFPRREFIEDKHKNIPSGIAVAPHGHYVYISDIATNAIFTCEINYHNGEFTSCAAFKDKMTLGMPISLSFY